MQKNRQLAEANLDLEPQFLVKKQELAVLYKQLSEAKERYTDLKSRIGLLFRTQSRYQYFLIVDALGLNYNPSTILALMQAANAEAEERSDVSPHFCFGDPHLKEVISTHLPRTSKRTDEATHRIYFSFAC